MHLFNGRKLGNLTDLRRNNYKQKNLPAGLHAEGMQARPIRLGG